MNTGYNSYYALGYVTKHINCPHIIARYVLNEPRVFRDITDNLIDRVLLYVNNLLSIDYILYASNNTSHVFTQVINAVKLTDNLDSSEFYEWFKSQHPNLPNYDEKFIYQNVLYEMQFQCNTINIELFTQKYSQYSE